MDDGVPGRRERNKAERRRRIVAAARAEFAQKGYPAATTRAIAERADVGIGTLFAYAADKEALLAMVVGDALRIVGRNAEAAVPPGAPFLDQVLALVRPRYAFWAADPALAQHAVKATFAAQFRPSGVRAATEEPEAPPQAGLRPVLAALAARAQADGRLGAGPPELIAGVILDIYLSESRDWIALSDVSVDAGVERLRALLEFALASVLPVA
jgi:AcrR family transcriptional regulator